MPAPLMLSLCFDSAYPALITVTHICFATACKLYWAFLPQSPPTNSLLFAFFFFLAGAYAA